MHAIEILTRVLAHTVDVPYTVEDIEEVSPATLWIYGHYLLEEGEIHDQILIGLRTYFKVVEIETSIEPDEYGWLKYRATLRRQPQWAQVAE